MAATPSEAPAPERRLHPLSFLFVFFAQSKGVLVALGVIVLFRRGGLSDVVGALAGAAVLALFAFIKARAFRYRLTGDELVVREGVFARTERHIPYGRVQNIVQRRNPLHRALGVTELRLESAGGREPEAVMAVITLEAAREVEALLRAGVGAPGAAALAEPPPETPLVVLSPGEILRLGLVTSRGWVAVGAGFVVLASTPAVDGKALRVAFRWLRQGLQGWSAAPVTPALGPETALAALGVLGLLLATIKLLSVVMAFLTFHGFQLRRSGERIRTEAGLITRSSASARLDTVQRLLVAESWLSRKLGRRWLSCAVAAGGANENDDGRRLSWLVPVGTPAQVSAVLKDLDPRLDLEALTWRPLHPRAWSRKLVVLATWATAASAPAVFLLGPLGLVLWAALLALAVVAARGWARFARHAHDGEVIAFRAGWWRRRWTVTWVAKGQVVVLSQSPFDRRRGMATVVLDTAGTSSESFHLQIPYLPEAEARALALELQRAASAPPAESAPALAPGSGLAP